MWCVGLQVNAGNRKVSQMGSDLDAKWQIGFKRLRTVSLGWLLWFGFGFVPLFMGQQYWCELEIYLLPDTRTVSVYPACVIHGNSVLLAQFIMGCCRIYLGWYVLGSHTSSLSPYTHSSCTKTHLLNVASKVASDWCCSLFMASSCQPPTFSAIHSVRNLWVCRSDPSLPQSVEFLS